VNVDIDLQNNKTYKHEVMSYLTRSI